MYIVQRGKKFRIFLLIVNIFSLPLGILGGIAVITYLQDGYSDSDSGVVLGCTCLFIYAAAMLGLAVYAAKKKIYISEGGLLVEGVFKREYFPREKLSRMKIIQLSLAVYSGDEKVVQITPIYAGYDELTDWLISNGIPMEGIDITS